MSQLLKSASSSFSRGHDTGPPSERYGARRADHEVPRSRPYHLPPSRSAVIRCMLSIEVRASRSETECISDGGQSWECIISPQNMGRVRRIPLMMGKRRVTISAFVDSHLGRVLSPPPQGPACPCIRTWHRRLKFTMTGHWSFPSFAISPPKQDWYLTASSWGARSRRVALVSSIITRVVLYFSVCRSSTCCDLPRGCFLCDIFSATKEEQVQIAFVPARPISLRNLLSILESRPELPQPPSSTRGGFG